LNVTRDIVLTACPLFNIYHDEGSYYGNEQDVLTINGVGYTGTNCPEGLALSAGTT
jgi:hypothetical protein